MKDMRTNLMVASLLLGGITPVLAWSMDEMSDGQLAQTAGQAGLTVTMALPPSNTLTVDQVALFDGGGFSGQANTGAIVIGKNANGSALGSEPTLGTGISLTTNKNISLVVDASGGAVAAGTTTGTAPLINVGINLPTVMTLITGDVGIAAGSGTAGSYKVGTAGSGDVLIMSSTSMTFNLVGSPLLTLQLGKSNQGGMLKFTSLNISSVVFNTPVNLVSPNGGVGASQLSMTPSVTNLDLTGATLDILTTANMQLPANFPAATTGGLLFQDSAISGVGIQLNNVTAGTLGNTDANFAGSMANAPIGSFGVTNMAVSNLKIGVSGM